MSSLSDMLEYYSKSANEKRKKVPNFDHFSRNSVLFGPSGETWTHDPLTPSQVRYQLRYTRIFVADVHESACIY